jgi:hypothetical protein
MSRAETGLPPGHARALIEQAIGIINGDRQLVAEATAEIAVIRAASSPKEQVRGRPRSRKKPPPRSGHLTRLTPNRSGRQPTSLLVWIFLGDATGFTGNKPGGGRGRTLSSRRMCRP